MTKDLEHRYAQVVETARHDIEFAFALSERLVVDYADQARSWYARAYVNRRMKKFGAAIVDVERAIRIEPNQPRGYNTAGEIQIYAGNFASAVKYLSVVIDQEDMVYRDRFVNEALIYRAFALMRLGEFTSALADLSSVELSGPVWLGALYTKEDLVLECESALRQKSGGSGS